MRYKLGPKPIEIIVLSSDDDEGSDDDGEETTDLRQFFPQDLYATLQASKFLHTKVKPKNGKYGDPAVNELWHEYVEKGLRGSEVADTFKKMGRGTTGRAKAQKLTTESAEPPKTQSHEKAEPKAPMNPSAAPVLGSLDQAPSTLPPAVKSCSGRWEAKNSRDLLLQRKNAPPPEEPPRHTVEVYFASNIGEEKHEAGELDLLEASWKCYWTTEAGRPRLQFRESPGHIIFPVFCSSGGRPETARLHLGEPMDGASYMQLVCVKRSELNAYKAANPSLDFFVLPESADKFGIGASRMWIVQLARIVCPKE